MDNWTEVAELAEAIEQANSSHDEDSARDVAIATARFLDRELGLETHHLRRVLKSITDTLEGRI
jgi:hypothetical protein